MDELLEITTPRKKMRRESEKREDPMKSIGMLLTIIAMTSGIVAFYYTDKINGKEETRKELTAIVREQENEHQKIHIKIIELGEVSEQLQQAVVRIERVQDKIEEKMMEDRKHSNSSPAIKAK